MDPVVAMRDMVALNVVRVCPANIEHCFISSFFFRARKTRLEI